MGESLMALSGNPGAAMAALGLPGAPDSVRAGVRVRQLLQQGQGVGVPTARGEALQQPAFDPVVALASAMTGGIGAGIGAKAPGWSPWLEREFARTRIPVDFSASMGQRLGQGLQAGIGNLGSYAMGSGLGQALGIPPSINAYTAIPGPFPATVEQNLTQDMGLPRWIEKGVRKAAASGGTLATLLGTRQGND